MKKKTTESSRTTVLNRIRKASEGAHDATKEYAALPRPYVRHGKLDKNETLALLVERLREYDAQVVETTPQALPGVIAQTLETSGRRTFLAPPHLPVQWLTPGFDWHIDEDLTIEEMEQADGAVTAAFCAVADSGTIVLHHSATEGRRAVTLLPDWHLCVLFESQVVETLPEYFARCTTAPVLATYISGPSATADIEMTRIKGVHGPRFLHVLLVRE